MVSFCRNQSKVIFDTTFTSLYYLSCQTKNPLKSFNFKGLIQFLFFSREDGIRTHDVVTHIQTFQACSFNHSDTSLFVDAKNNKIFDLKKQIFQLL